MAATVACVALVLALAGLAQTSAGRRATRGLGLFALSEPYTALYFTDPRAVAAATEGYAGRVRRTTVSFVIRSAEHGPTRYRWTISVNDRVAAAGAAQLAPGAQVQIARAVTTGCRPSGGGPQVLQTPPSRGRRQVRRARRVGHVVQVRRVGQVRHVGQVRITVALARPAHLIGYWFSCRA